MTEHFLRRKWMPTSETELFAAYKSGLLAEKNWCDLKAALGTTASANAELARDLASFATNGGTLIIGLNEKEPDGSPLTPIELTRGLSERIEQIAAMKVDPPLTVECVTLASDTDAGKGYVLVHVPASPLAPHQVEGKYLGRGDKTKRYLADSEVAALFRRRQQWDESAEGALRDFVQSNMNHIGGHVIHEHSHVA